MLIVSRRRRTGRTTCSSGVCPSRHPVDVNRGQNTDSGGDDDVTTARGTASCTEDINGGVNERESHCDIIQSESDAKTDDTAGPRIGK